MAVRDMNDVLEIFGIGEMSGHHLEQFGEQFVHSERTPFNIFPYGNMPTSKFRMFSIMQFAMRIGGIRVIFFFHLSVSPRLLR